MACANGLEVCHKRPGRGDGDFFDYLTAGRAEDAWRTEGGAG